MTGPSDKAAWQDLLRLSGDMRRQGLRIDSLFSSDPHRFRHFSCRLDGLLLDYSKQLITTEAFASLIQLAEQCYLPAAIDAMFAGEAINVTEQRAAMHVALRAPTGDRSNGEVEKVLDHMSAFVASVHDGSWTGYSGQAIRDVVNIGIGGSDLGPAMVTEALADCHLDGLRVHFVSNVDPVHLQDTLNALQPATTLFIVASKSFSTLETLQNAQEARRWLLQAGLEEADIAKHFVANTVNTEAAVAFGIAAENLFPMWDWVGGRFSLWSAIGLPIALAIGMDNFRRLLAGAHHIDEHFRSADLEHNLPVIMALLTIWNTGFFGCHSTAIVPYSQRLQLLPAYLQQLYMESLGKRITLDGDAVATNTGEVLWGSAGTNGQHSYFQLLHQGSQTIPAEFIAFAKPPAEPHAESHTHLLANCFSQSLALMAGDRDAPSPHRHIPGNKPSSTLLLSQLDPFKLGSLLALYEHKVYAQSVIWHINAFDQWGVELGKQLSSQVAEALGDNEGAAEFDTSTAGLIRFVKEWTR